MDGEDDQPQLSAAALAALKEFMEEKEQQPTEKDGVPFVPADWGLAQFWYTKETADLLADEAIRVADGGKIACLCAPSAFRALYPKYEKSFVFEVDERFNVFGDRFFRYDLFEWPPVYSPDLKGTFDCCIIDPPHLNADTLSKVVDMVKWLSRKEDSPVIVLTGAVMEDDVFKLLKARRTKWDPEHDDTIQNPFACYTNFASERFGGWVAPTD
eukprot:NODE_7356_length_772_cov_164.318952_g7114_i0.p1 GENE.NODE_7356_length_772_cov_164.318952_g7114_i0~~NODE_7356_length_772_cov_164.318952_g7114_i0.p1  ORF type:complete len:238 (+),score=64.27 NODE_7356_length_772_cov_164.318952_g7114_i0:76-714(+)